MAGPGKAGASPLGGRRKQRPQAGRAQLGGVGAGAQQRPQPGAMGYNARLGQPQQRGLPSPVARGNPFLNGMGGMPRPGNRRQDFSPRGRPAGGTPGAPMIPQPAPGPAPAAPSPGGPGAGSVSQASWGAPGMQGVNVNTRWQGPNLNRVTAKYQEQMAKLPMTPEGEAMRRQLEDRLRAEIAQQRAGYGMAASQMNLGLGRLGTDYGIAREQLGSSLADRGVMGIGSGVMSNMGQLQSNDFNRQRQDLMNQGQAQMQDYLGQASNSFLNYGQGMNELILNLQRQIQGDRTMGRGA